MTTARLGDVAEFINGFPFKPEDWHEGGLPIVRIQNLTDPSKPINATTRPVPDRFRVIRGELLVSWSATLGVFVWNRTAEALVNQHIFRVVPTSRVDQGFLRHMLEGALVSMERHLHGATMKHVNRGEFLSTEIPLPALDEQRRIAAILDHADALRAKRRQVLSHLDTLTQSLYDTTFRGAPTRTIRELLARGALLVHKDGNHGSLYPRAEDFDTDGVPFLTAKVVKDDGTLDLSQLDRLSEDKAARLKIGWIQQNDVLLSHNASVGKVATYMGELGSALIGTSLTCFRPDGSQLLGRFLFAALRSAQFQRGLRSEMAQTTRNQVPITAQRELSVPWLEPSAQQELASKSNAVDVAADSARRASVRSDELFASLQSRAFRGEL